MKDEDFAYEQLRQKRIDNMNLSDRVRAGSEAAPTLNAVRGSTT